MLVTFGICIVLGILAASYLSMVQTQRFSVARAQSWNISLAVAEAGVEEAMAEINDTNVFAKLGWKQPGNQWTWDTSAGTISKTNIYLDNGNYYNVTVYSQADAANAPTADARHPVIIATGYVPGPVSTAPLARTVRVQATPITYSVPYGAMVAMNSVDFKGFNISTDSFDSTKTNLFPGGIYNTANRMDHGDVSTLSTNSSDLNSQNGKVRGSMHTPPNWTATSANIGAQGSIGDNTWVGSGNTGIEMSPPHATNDAVQSYADASLPAFGTPPLTPVKRNFMRNRVTYTGYYLLTTNNPWVINNLNGSIYVDGPNVQLELTGSSASVPSGGQILVPDSTDSQGNHYSLSMYVAATSFTVNGTGYANAGGAAKYLQYYGLPSNTSLTLGGNGSFVAQIYAPEADFKLGGGGNNNTYDFSGMCVVRSVTMNGNFNFHFDEATKDTLILAGFTAHSWSEL